MIRFALLTLAIVSIVPTAQLGCPATQSSSDEVTPTARTIITTTAEALVADTGQPAETVTYRTAVTLRASSTAGDSQGTVSYAWLQTSGPGVQITDADQPSASFIAPSVKADQTLVIMVTARGEAGGVGRAEVRVLITADPNFTPYNWGTYAGSAGQTATGPVANAGQKQSGVPGATVTLDGSKSTGTQLTYRWRQASGRTAILSGADTVSASVTLPAYVADGDNNLIFELTVTDADNNTASDLVTIKINNPDVSDRRVVVATSMGNFTMELNPEEAPITVENFFKYVDEGFYDGTLFHRVIPDFVIQGGGYTPGLNAKKTGDPITNESSNGLKNVRGSVAMARTSDPDTATSQWYVNLADNDFLDYTDGKPGYAVFGTVIAGMDVVDRIATVTTETRSGFSDVPVDDVTILSVRREGTSTSGTTK